VEELEGEKNLEPPLPKLNEEERELEYQQMIDKLNNTLSAALARGERRRRRRLLDICGRDPPCSIINQTGLVFVLFACIVILLTSNIIADRYLISK
jgi:hypothetical protein